MGALGNYAVVLKKGVIGNKTWRDHTFFKTAARFFDELARFARKQHLRVFC